MGVLPDWAIRKQCKIEPFAEGEKREGVISYGLSSYGYDIRAGYKWKVFTNVWGQVVDPKHFNEKAFVDVDVTPQHEWAEDPLYPDRHHDYCMHCATKRHDFNKGFNQLCAHSTAVVIPPNSFALAESMEYVEIPRSCQALVIGKSTYARCGIVLNCTPLEPEWKGRITLEVSNTTPLPAKVYAGEGIGQVLFFQTGGALESSLRHVIELQGMPPGLLDQAVAAWMKASSCKTSYADKKGKYQDQQGLTLPKVD